MNLETYFLSIPDRPQADEEELYFGEIRRVPAPTERQLRWFANLAIHFGTQLRASACQIQTDQVRILVPEAQCVRACGACINEGMPLYHPLDHHRSAFGNPRLIADFPKNADELRLNEADFLRSYAKLSDLRVYALLQQEPPSLAVWIRDDETRPWERFELTAAHSSLPLPLQGLHLDAIEILDDLAF